VTEKQPGAQEEPGSSNGRKTLHDLFIALAFIGMVIAPAIVASNSRVEVGDDEQK
jgi:hypothetical protein